MGNQFCVFPFKYKGKTHMKCTREDSKNGAYWCATAVNKEQQVVHGKWEDCGGDCPLNLEEDHAGD